MTLYQPAYRLAVYAPRSVDPSEATVLTPASGAPHTDPFKVASIKGVAGFQPYLGGEPQGSRGPFDPLKRKVQTGHMSFTLQDQRVTAGGTNLDRWVTTFLGDAKGKEILGGCKLVADESLDLGGSWGSAPFWTGRIVDLVQISREEFRLETRNLVDDLATPCFVGPPHSSITYATLPRLWPVELSAVAYGPWTASTKRLAVKVLVPPFTGQGAQLTLLNAADPTNIVTQGLTERVDHRAPIRALSSLDLVPRRRVRARIRWTSGAMNGQTKDYWLATVVYFGRGGNNPQTMVDSFTIVPLPTSDPNYGALPVLNVTGEAEFLNWDGPSENAPLYINDVDVMTLQQDLLDGKFGYLKDDGAVLRSYGKDASAFTALVGKFPMGRWIITGPWSLRDFMEQQIGLAFGAGYRLDTQNRVVPFDVRLPSSLAGIPTLVDADCAELPTRWEHLQRGGLTSIEVQYYRDDAIAPSEVQQTQQQFPEFASTLIRSTQQSTGRLAIDRAVDLGEQPLVIDAQGLRTTALDVDQKDGVQRTIWLRSTIDALIASLWRPFGGGPMTVTIPCRRTATVTGANGQPGALLLVQVSTLPDPATHRRGGVRLCQVLDASPDGPVIELKLLDLGIGEVATAPTLGTPAKDTNNPKHGINLPITLNASSEPVAIQVAVTDQAAGSAPVAESDRWMPAGRALSTGTANLVGYPSKSRVWPRARSEPDVAGAAPRLPSPWVSPATAFVDLDAYAAPTGLAAANITATTADLSWTNTETTVRVEVLLGSSRLVLLPAGSNKFKLQNLVRNAANTVKVRYVDGLGGIGTEASLVVTTNTNDPTAPAAIGIRVIPGPTGIL